MKYLRKTLEFGFSATILSTLLLTACGGGGGAAVAANPAAAGGTTVTLTPVKGKFEGKCVVSISNTAGATLFTGTQTINPNGTTTVTLPAGSTGPYLVSIQGDATGTQCLYFNDNAANPRLIAMGASESLNALVSTNDLTAASGVAITSLSEMAYQAASAIHGGHLRNLTENSPEIAQGIAAAVSLAGLTGASAVASIFTPPRTIPASGIAANDDLGRTLVNIANINATKPMDAIRLMSYHAQSAVGVPPSASAVAALSPLNFVGQGQAFGLQIQANKQAAASAVVNAGNVASFLAAITSASGVGSFSFGLSSPMNSFPAYGELDTATLMNGVYSVVVGAKDLIGGAWTPQVPTGFVLTPRGWTPSAQQKTTFTMNPEGTAHAIQEGFGVMNVIITRQSLTGVSFASAVVAAGQQNSPLNTTGGLNANGQLVLDASGVPTAANIVPTGSFTAGAVAYNTMEVASAVTSQDIYEVQANPSNTVNAVNTGTQLTALPAAGTAFCTYNNTRYMQPSATVAGAYDMFDLMAQGGGLNVGGACALPAGSVPFRTVKPVTVTVNGMTMMKFAISPTYADVITVVSGKPGVPNGVYLVFYRPKGTLNGSNKSWLNYSAFQQLFTALGLPLF
ncbi:MAG: hypothetical protein WAO71_03845 [Gallionella sp.]